MLPSVTVQGVLLLSELKCCAISKSLRFVRRLDGRDAGVPYGPSLRIVMTQFAQPNLMQRQHPESTIRQPY